MKVDYEDIELHKAVGDHLRNRGVHQDNFDTAAVIIGIMKDQGYAKVERGRITAKALIEALHTKALVGTQEEHDRLSQLVVTSRIYLTPVESE